MTKVSYGMTGSIEKDFGDMTVSELLSDRNTLAAIGAPEGVVAVSRGETLDGDRYVADFSNITLEKRAASKA